MVIQYLLQYWILKPNLQAANIESLLDHRLFFLLVVSTVIITATGYIINDIVDRDIDRINKPNKQIVDRVISTKHAWQTYWVLVAFGLAVSLYVACRIDNLPLISIYPIAIVMLALYSLRLKKMALSGNLIVSLFSAMVAGIIYFAEREAIADLITHDPSRFLFVILVFYAYMIFAFLTSMYREIVKDIEDIEGDRQADARTLPILIGKQNSKWISGVFAIVVLLLSNYWLYLAYDQQNYGLAVSILVLVVIPLMYSMVKLYSAQDSKSFHHISTVIKCVMAGGIVCLLSVNYA